MGKLETILSKLRKVHPNGNGYTACCPAHDDQTPSLSVSETEDGHILVYCHAGCEAKAITHAIGLSFADLMPDAADTDSNRAARAPRAILSDATRNSPRFDTAEQALAALEQRHGKPTTTWTYENASGDRVGVVARWDTGGRKTFRPVSLLDGKWLHRGMASPRPLYHLQQIAAATKDDFLSVHEGEKAADAALGIGMPSTTSAHGARSAALTDWSPLAGREIAIFPDNDPAGETYAGGVVTCLRRLSPRPTIRIVRLPGLPQGGDIVEYIAQQRAAGLDASAINAKVRAIVAGVPVLDDDDGELSWRPFPTSVLPGVVRRFVEDYAKAMDCDTSLLALPMLSMLAGCIGVARVVQLRHSWSEPAIIWTAVVTPSGSMKTPALRATTEQLHLAQRDGSPRGESPDLSGGSRTVRDRARQVEEGLRRHRTATEA